jgi:hypothetical protein
MIGWRSELVDGVDRLTQVRFMECVTEDDGDFGETQIKQVRVFSRAGDQVAWSIYRRSNAGASDGWAVHDQGMVTIGEIALCPVYLNRTAFMQGLPPLSDLAEVNLAHWQSQSDQRNILHAARVPILFWAGKTDNSPVEIGAFRMLTSSDPNSKLSYVEHKSEAIGAGRQDIKDLEEQMQVLGLELLVSKPSGQTATGETIDQAKMNSSLAMMANALKDALEQAFGFMALYAGLDRDAGGGSLTINTDFGISMRGTQDTSGLLQAVKDGVISRETCIRELKRRGILSDDIDEAEEVQKALDEATSTNDTAGDVFAAYGLPADSGDSTGADAP